MKKCGKSNDRQKMLPATGKGKLDRQPDLHDGEDSRLNVVFNFIPDMHSREGAKNIRGSHMSSVFHVTNLKIIARAFMFHFCQSLTF